MTFFKEKKGWEMITNLLAIESETKLADKIITLQNEISVNYDSKVLVVTSLDENVLAAAFATALAKVYVDNGSSALLIDANLYDICLDKLLSVPRQKASDKNADLEMHKLQDRLGVVCFDEETYPAKIYKSGTIQRLVEKNGAAYEHAIIIMPSAKSHKEISLLSDVLDSVLLVARRDYTKKSDIYYALQYLSAEKLPVSKTVIIK